MDWSMRFLKMNVCVYLYRFCVGRWQDPSNPLLTSSCLKSKGFHTVTFWRLHVNCSQFRYSFYWNVCLCKTYLFINVIYKAGWCFTTNFLCRKVTKVIRYYISSVLLACWNAFHLHAVILVEGTMVKFFLFLTPRCDIDLILFWCLMDWYSVYVFDLLGSILTCFGFRFCHL